MTITSGPIDYKAPNITFLRLGSTDIGGIIDEVQEWLDTFWRRPDYLVISTKQLAFIELESDPTLMFPADKSSTHIMNIPYIEIFLNEEDGKEWIIRRDYDK
jgi:hypothetical protein